MSISPHVLLLVAIALLVVWRLYARTRRQFGRQPLKTRRLRFRVGLFVVIALLVAGEGVVAPRVLAGLAAGLVGGALLGMLSLKLTRFEIDGSNDCYYPNVWIGVALTALFIGRLAWRFAVLWPEMSHGIATGNAAQWQRSPLTLLVLGLLLGYYIAYYGGLLLHHRRALATLPRLRDDGKAPVPTAGGERRR